MIERKHKLGLTYVWGVVWVMLLLAVDCLSSLVLSPISLGETTIVAPRVHSLSYGLVPWGLVFVVAFVGLSLVSSKFILIPKEANSLASTLLLSGFVALQYPVDWLVLLVVLLLLLSLAQFLSTYQREEAPHSYVHIGVMLSALSLIDVRMLLFVPLWCYTSYQMSSLSVRSMLAMAVGLLSPVLLFGAYLALEYRPWSVPTLVEAWFDPLLSPEPTFLQLGRYGDLFGLSLLSLVAGFTAESSSISVRQRNQYALLSAWAVYGAIVLVLYPSVLTASLCLLSSSILGARAIHQLDDKPYKLCIAVLGLMLIITSVLV